MARKVVQAKHIQKAGNVLRTFLIWGGIVVVLAAGLVEFFWPGNEKIVLFMLVAVGLAYGAALLDFDVDDDD